jgi:hypothetical protein
MSLLLSSLSSSPKLLKMPAPLSLLSFHSQDSMLWDILFLSVTLHKRAVVSQLISYLEVHKLTSTQV